MVKQVVGLEGRIRKVGSAPKAMMQTNHCSEISSYAISPTASVLVATKGFRFLV